MLRRQANILSGEYDLCPLLALVTAHTLIEKMLSSDPLERPPARAILKHPIFWTSEKILAFFQDVSDRVEKDTTESAVLQSLERAAHDVVRGSWRIHLEEVVMQDLRRHRTYQGRSVRDLLRALRNKVFKLLNLISLCVIEMEFLFLEKSLSRGIRRSKRSNGPEPRRILCLLD